MGQYTAYTSKDPRELEERGDKDCLERLQLLEML